MPPSDLPRRVAVAYSGGRDSTALLHATLQVAAAHGVEVWALHVNHGLSAMADAWERQCADQCAAWSVGGLPLRFAAQRLVPPQQRPRGTEAWARDARYTALGEMAAARGAGLVLLAHHRRDQAETVVLQALRGGGVDGWSAMPAATERDGLTWGRPWLDASRDAIDDYVALHGLSFVDDDSNSDIRHARNRLRLETWPALIAAFPQAEAALAGVARRSQEASNCLAELARLDLGDAADGSPLAIAAWAALSTARRGNALRAWLRTATGAPAPASVVARLLAEVSGDAECGNGGQWWALPGGQQVRHWRGRLIVVAAAPAPAFTGSSVAPIDVRRSGLYRIEGWPGLLRVRAVERGGVAVDMLRAAVARPRMGGERFQAAVTRPARSLKLQYQAAGVAAWLRQGPLIHADGRLVFVPGLGIDARVMAQPGLPQAALAWEPEADGDHIRQR